MNITETIRPVALITGGGSGIGAAFSHKLAFSGYDIIIIDKDPDSSQKLIKELRLQFPCNADFFYANLSNADDCIKVQTYIESLDKIDLLINNAGFGTTGTFTETSFHRQLDMISVHILASVRFCRSALPGMIRRSSGSIINVCSITAFTRFPETAIYSSSKAFLLVFSECLAAELLGTGIKIQALCPGQTNTGFTKTSEMKAFDPSRVPKFLWMSTEQVVDASLEALNRGSTRCIPGLKNQLYVFIFGNRIISLVLNFLRKHGILEALLKLFRSCNLD